MVRADPRYGSTIKNPPGILGPLSEGERGYGHGTLSVREAHEEPNPLLRQRAGALCTSVGDAKVEEVRNRTLWTRARTR